jgi:hypothetical protein
VMVIGIEVVYIELYIFALTLTKAQSSITRFLKSDPF